MLAYADQISAAIDRAVQVAWREVLKLVQPAPASAVTSWHQHHQRGLKLFRAIPHLIRHSIATELANLARRGYTSAVACVVDVLPLPALQAAALGESRILTEDEPAASDPLTRFLNGLISLHAGPDVQVNPLIDAIKGTTDKDEQRRLFAQLLFPPPPRETLDRIIYSGDWQARLAAQSKLASPEAMANILANGFALGQTPRQIASQLKPLVQGVSSSAQRVARTEGMRVAHHVQMTAWDELGDNIIGYQIHAQLDQNTRAWHAARSGTIYYRNPKPGQKGLAQMPHPPQEPDDPAERPAGAPHTAPNCRCRLSPVLAPLGSITSDPAKAAIFQDNNKGIITDPETYDRWFSQADERLRRQAVGSRRYQTIASRLDREPVWADFIHPKTGDLLTVSHLATESQPDRKERVNKVNLLIAQRRALLRKTGTYGFVP